MSFLVASLVASLVLTIVLNAGLALFRRRPHPRDAGVWRSPYEPSPSPLSGSDRNVKTRVVFPWKAMLAVSIVATVVVNLLR